MSNENDVQNARIGDWIQTYSGSVFYPLDPRSTEVNMRDIAHSLSMTCRFAGHCLIFYSVAEHSIRVKNLAMKRYNMLMAQKHPSVQGLSAVEVALWALIHDGAEAIISDIGRPIKKSLSDDYEKIEEKILFAIAEKLQLPTPPSQAIIDIVKWADNTALATEQRDIMAPAPMPWNLPQPPDPEMIIIPYASQEMERAYLGELGVLLAHWAKELQVRESSKTQVGNEGVTSTDGRFSVASGEEKINNAG